MPFTWLRPAGFSDSGRLWHETVLLPAVLAAGLVPKDPWGGPSPITDVLESLPYGHELREALQAANLKQGRIDLDLVDQSEAVLACLDGPDVDSGTAVEVGYAFARHKLIVGLRTDIRRSADNDGSLVNLMVETCIFRLGRHPHGVIGRGHRLPEREARRRILTVCRRLHESGYFFSI